MRGSPDGSIEPARHRQVPRVGGVAQLALPLVELRFQRAVDADSSRKAATGSAEDAAKSAQTSSQASWGAQQRGAECGLWIVCADWGSRPS
jgi:hypothetical protein